MNLEKNLETQRLLTFDNGSIHSRFGADLWQVFLLDDVLQQRLRVAQALDDAVHEALENEHTQKKKKKN